MADVLREALIVEGNRALQSGAAVAFVLAAVNVVALPVLMASGAATGLEIPWAFTALAGLLCGVIWALARRRRLHGWVAWAVMLPFVSLPTAFFLLSHFALPSGAATFITGPFSYLYFVVIAVTALLFDLRLSLAAGVVAAGGYLGVYLLDREHLSGVAAGDPVLLQDLTALPIYAVKALMILFGAALVGALAVVARRLVHRAVRESRQRETVHRLLGQYVSDEVRDRLLRDGLDRGGERREVAILFSDIRGFTRYGEDADPDEVVSRLNAYFDAMVAAIAAEGGVVDKFIGDAVMAVFGGVVPVDDPGAAALRAALGMRHALARLNDQWAAEGLAPFDNGIGVHLGEVVQGSIGSANRKDFTIIGDSVNLASRVEGLTKDAGFAILVTGAVHERLPGALKALCRPLGERAVKGRRATVGVFGVTDDPGGEAASGVDSEDTVGAAAGVDSEDTVGAAAGAAG